MSETGIKGIVYDKLPLNVMNIAFMRKLNEFDCAVVMDEQGNGKHSKAQLAVLEAVVGVKNPSVLIITTGKLMYEWYGNLLKGIGADFKFITPDPGGVCFFSPKLSNLYIADSRAGDNPIFKRTKEAGVVWDLVIVDGGLSRNGIDSELILNGFDLKAKKMVVFAAYLNAARDAAEKLAKLPEKFLANKTKADYFSGNYPKDNITEFTLSSPYSRYYGTRGLVEPKLKLITYTANEEAVRAKSDQAAPAVYGYGGNIFEELTLDMRKLYNADKYDDKIVTSLREFDVKLDAYINRLAKLAEDPDNRIITYFSSEKTLDYVYKVLSTSAVGLKPLTKVKKSGIYRIDDTMRCFEAGDKQDIRILLSMDDQDEQCDLLDNITHVINYELPNSPLTLNRRYKQGGRNGFSEPEFILFRDDTDKFDGRMLRRVLALNLCAGFSYGIPGRNVYLHTEGLENMLAEVIKQLEGVENLDNSASNELAALYNLKTSGQTARTELAKARDDLMRAFGISSGKTDRAVLADIIGKRLEELRKGCCCFDSDGKLQVKSYNVEESQDYADLEAVISDDALVKERDEARGLLDGCKTADKLYELLHTTEENDRGYVYYCAWRYLAENHGFDGDYNKFLKDIFEEAI
ncbi:MAG: hypothetical protein NC394_02760 [Bacteroides sp.]|nr:hypothetical protein [Bacteroides sp.]